MELGLAVTEGSGLEGDNLDYNRMENKQGKQDNRESCICSKLVSVPDV